ncbi:uncharacterized protein BJ212DRAFT_1479269 [Suillus subaureus]|uniref:Uncharacterized protein n=1 Tax=Suillus subaureus TaxID=48587 RepID=A0A9P7EDZ6_9AGAM|nr:uncharacterized protein BJ212DRAFT_1479269 [Suillus subaureus]KAG1819161.1 hypothetical protein BJ212DRAFT_1479269 [Suillus subaureus]
MLKESHELQDQAALEGLQWLAAMQAGMVEAEELTHMKKLKPVKPCACPVTKQTAPALPTNKKVLAAGNAGENSQDDNNSNNNYDRIKHKPKTQKHGKISLKDAINNAQSSVPAVKSACVKDKKGKSAAMPLSSAYTSTQATSVSSTKTCSKSKVLPAPANKIITAVLTGSSADDTLDDSQEHLDTITSKTKGKKSFIKITTEPKTNDVMVGSKGKSVETDLNAPMDTEVAASSDMEGDPEDDNPTDVEGDLEDNNPMDVEDNLLQGKDANMPNSDSSNDLLTYCPIKKCKLVSAKPHNTVLVDMLSSSKEPDALPIDVIENIAKRVMQLTSSTTVTVSKAAVTEKPSAKKVKTEDGANDNTKSMLIPLPGYWIEKQYKSHSTYQNCDLPPQCQDQWWPKHFLLTIYLWAGSQDDLWQFMDAPLIDTLQCIFDVVYPDLRYKVTAQGSVFSVATQRLAEWHSNFRSMGLAIMIDFFA